MASRSQLQRTILATRRRTEPERRKCVAHASRIGYIAWSMYLAKGLGEEAFLLEFERQADPWLRVKLVGQKISALRQGFRKLNEAERATLAQTGETELKTGLELLGKDKKTIQDLISMVDPPPAQ